MSPRERRALARIEADLVSGDPCLEQRMSRGRTEPWRWLVRSVVAVPVGVFAGVAAWVLIPASWWALLAVVLTLVVMPCLLLWATEGWTKR